MMPYESELVIPRHRAGEIDDRQDGEDEGLHESHEDMKKDEDHPSEDGHRRQGIAESGEAADENEEREREAEKDDVEQLAHEHIDPQTDGEREQAREVADDFDHHHQGRKVDVRTQEMRPVVQRA